jgi:exopolysaccharide biosynthesis polyprenyl glycosylphosphotransferase
MKFVPWSLRISDVASLWLGVLIAFQLRFYSEIIPVFTPIPEFSLYVKTLIVLSPFYLLFMNAMGNYAERRGKLTEYEIHNLFRSLAFFYLLCLSLSFFIRSHEFSRVTLILSFFLNFLFCLVLRLIWTSGFSQKVADRVLLIGTNTGMLAEVKKSYEEDFGGVGSVSLDSRIPSEHTDFDRIIIVGGEIDFADLADMMLHSPRSTRIDLIPSYHFFLRNLPFKESIGIFPVLSLNQQVLSGWSAFTKRTLDVWISALFLVLLSPALLLIAACLRLLFGGPVLFRQERVGQNGRSFTIYKFRTMNLEAETEIASLLEKEKRPNYKSKDDPRVLGKFGRFLRRSSLDELPQFWNVFQGSMSLVGPRPAPLEFVKNYSSVHKLRLAIPPGMTGLQQIHCRGTESMEEILEYDLRYIRKQSLWFDVMILLRTIPHVLFGRGVH